jgi:hypothetical protein
LGTSELAGGTVMVVLHRAEDEVRAEGAKSFRSPRMPASLTELPDFSVTDLHPDDAEATQHCHPLQKL